MKNENGFSLIELVVAMAIMVGLSAVAIPTYTNLVGGINEKLDQMAIEQQAQVDQFNAMLAGVNN